MNCFKRQIKSYNSDFKTLRQALGRMGNCIKKLTVLKKSFLTAKYAKLMQSAQSQNMG
jgi:hypothetical protein